MVRTKDNNKSGGDVTPAAPVPNLDFMNKSYNVRKEEYRTQTQQMWDK